MKVKTLMMPLLACLLGCASINFTSNASLEKVDAAYSSVEYNKTFSEGLDSNWQKINDSSNNFYLEGNSPSAKLSSFDYNNGSFRSTNSLTVPSSSTLVYDFTLDFSNMGTGEHYLCFSPLYDGAFLSAWGNMMYLKTGDKRLKWTAGNPSEVDLTTTSWDDCCSNNKISLRIFFNAGSSGVAAGSFHMFAYNPTKGAYDYIIYSPAGFTYNTTGYVWFGGNQLTGNNISASLSDIKIGYAADANAASAGNITNLIDATNNIQSNFTHDAGASSNVQFIAGAKQFKYNSPISSSGLLCNSVAVSSSAVQTGLAATVTLKQTYTNTGSNKLVGIVAGASLTETTINQGYGAGLYVDGSGNVQAAIRNLNDNSNVAVSPLGVTAASLIDAELIETLEIYTNYIKLSFNVGTLSSGLTANVTVNGYAGVVSSDISSGTAQGKLNSFKIVGKAEVIKNGRYLDLGFDYQSDLNAFDPAQNPEGQSRITWSISNSKLSFSDPHTGEFLNTRGEYANFTLTTEIVASASSFEWMGFTIGSNTRYSASNNFIANDLYYVTASEAVYFDHGGDQTKASHGVTLGTNTHLFIKLEAIDGTVSVYVSSTSTFGSAVITIQNKKTDGFIGIAYTEGVSYSIESFKLVNNDSSSPVNPTITTGTTSTSVVIGNSVSGVVSASSAYSNNCSYKITDKSEFSGLGVLSMTEGGSWTFDCSTSVSKGGEHTFTYEANDFGLKSTGTITIRIKTDAVAGIAIVTNNTFLKTEFNVGDAFTSYGLTVRALEDVDDPTVYNALAPDQYVVDSSNVDMSKAGTYTVKVSLAVNEEIFTTYDISVIENPLLPLSIGPGIATTSYNYEHGSESKIEIGCDFKGDSLTSIKFNNTVLTSPKDYTLSDSSITLKASFLETLNEGSHEFIAYISTGGTKFVVNVTLGGSSDPSPAVITNPQTFIKGQESLFITVDMKGEAFKSIELDTNAIDSKKYEVGSNSITIQGNLFDNLASGKHTITIKTEGGIASLNLFVKEQNQKPVPVTTLPPTFGSGSLNYNVNSGLTLSNTFDLKDQTLSYVLGNGYILTNGVDYEINGNNLILKNEYLGQFLPAETLNVSFVTYGGKGSFTVLMTGEFPSTVPTVSKSLINVESENVVTLDTKGFELQYIEYKGYELQGNLDFTYVDGKLTIKEYFYSDLADGNHPLTIVTNGGSVVLTLHVGN